MRNLKNAVKIINKLQLLYVPCVWAIFQQLKQKSCATCYIFMLYLGIADVIGLFCTGWQCGIQSLKGIVFCQWPLPAFCISNIGVCKYFYLVHLQKSVCYLKLSPFQLTKYNLVCWYIGNSTTLVLAINRCLVIYDNDLCDRLFKGRRGTLWLIIPTVVGFVGIWFTPPFLYSPIDSSAIVNPHRHYLPDTDIVCFNLSYTYWKPLNFFRTGHRKITDPPNWQNPKRIRAYYYLIIINIKRLFSVSQQATCHRWLRLCDFNSCHILHILCVFCK